MRLHIFITLLVLLLTIAPARGQAALPVKQVVAPASDIESGQLTLPDPVELGVTSRTVLLEIDPQQADENGLIDLAFPFVTGDGLTRVVFLPAKPDAWVGIVNAIDDDARQQLEARTDADIERPGVTLVRDPLPWGDSGKTYPALTLPAGQGGLHVQIQLRERIGGFILLDTDPDRSLYTYVKQRRTLVDQPITLINALSDGSRIVTLRALVRAPDGSRETIVADADADRLSFTPSMPGKHAIQVYAEYANEDNWPVLLTTQHLIEVQEPTTPLGEVRVTPVNDLVELSFADADSDDRVILAAEVWGRVDGVMSPVCWLSRVCDARRSLFFDTRWVSLAGADPATLELRQVRVHDVESMVPTQIIERLAFEMDGALIRPAPVGFGAQSVSFQPSIQVQPVADDDASSRGALPGGHRLLLVHGYCSDGNPFTTSHFSGDIAAFNDPDISRSHDAFALEILNQTAAMKSFGVAAHSQGAMAALHLYTFYFSGLDWARGDRLIQSVGAPYQGTPLAGNAAVLGDLFGTGCGENTDMTYTGSANWLSLIPTSSRQQVWYYTTSFEDRPFAFDYCNIITDLLLSDPDDGVIERSRGQLPGATNMGHVEGWCHTTGMRDPAQCTDASRNATINARARR